MSSKSKGPPDVESQGTSGPQKEPVKTSTGDSLYLEEIRIRAHEIYIERDGQPGDGLSDWLQAEREIESNARSNS